MSERADPVGLLPRSGVGRAALLAVLWTVVGVIFALPNIGGPGSAVLALGLLADAVVGVGAASRRSSSPPIGGCPSPIASSPAASPRTSRSASRSPSSTST